MGEGCGLEGLLIYYIEFRGQLVGLSYCLGVEKVFFFLSYWFCEFGFGREVVFLVQYVILV